MVDDKHTDDATSGTAAVHRVLDARSRALIQARPPPGQDAAALLARMQALDFDASGLEGRPITGLPRYVRCFGILLEGAVRSSGAKGLKLEFAVAAELAECRLAEARAEAEGEPQTKAKSLAPTTLGRLIQ